MDFDTSELLVLAADLSKASAEVQRKGTIVVQKCAFDAQRIMQQEAPVDTGALKNSVGVSFSSGGAALSAEVGPTVNYAAYVARGTRRMAANPFDLRTAEQISPIFEAAVKSLGGEVLG